MPPPRKKRPRRTPDGRPEMRSPDQILKEASEEISGDLPGKNVKVDLKTYFQSGDEHRVANRILKENGVLPLHLQDRKDAEEARRSSGQALEDDLARLGEQIETLSEMAEELAGWCSLPDAVQSLVEAPVASRENPIELLGTVCEKIRNYNVRRIDALARYRDGLESANEATRRYNSHVVATGRLLPACPSEPLIDVASRLADAESRLPDSIQLTDDDIDQMAAEIRAARSPWKRLKQRLLSGTPR